MTQICVGNLTTIIGSENGLLPGRHQAIIWTNDGILLIGPLVANFSEILVELYIYFIPENAFENVLCKTGAILPRPHCVNFHRRRVLYYIWVYILSRQYSVVGAIIWKWIMDSQETVVP